MKVIAICGLGGAGKEILDLVERINEKDKKWDEIIFCDKIVHEDIFREYRVYTFEDIQVKMSNQDVEFIISVGDVYLRKKIYEQIIEQGYKLATLVAPGVYLPKSTIVGEGVIIRDNSYIAVDTIIGDNSIIQPNVAIGHDVKIGKHSIISSQSVIAGGVTIGENTFIALGCKVKELVKVGSGTIVSMGTVVNKNIEENVIVRGNPMEVISKNYLKSAFSLNRRNL